MPSTTSSRDSADPDPTDSASAGAGPAALAEAVARRTGRPFADPSLLELALRHRSWCAEHPGEPSNERLELLGDAVLGMVVTDHVFHRFPTASEGELAKIRASVVSAVTLSEAVVSAMDAVFRLIVDQVQRLRLRTGSTRALQHPFDDLMGQAPLPSRASHNSQNFHCLCFLLACSVSY